MDIMDNSPCSGAGRANRPRRYAYAVSAGELQASSGDVCGEAARNGQQAVVEVTLSHFIRAIWFAYKTRCLNIL
jgi:hypothetical protein